MARWSPRADEGTEEGHAHDDYELGRREEERERNRGEHRLLQRHREADNRTDHNTQQGARHDENEGLVEVQYLNASLGKAHGSQDADLLCLVEQVGAHTRRQTEEAQDHGDHDDDVEDDVEDLLHRFGSLGIIVKVTELNSVSLLGREAAFAVGHKVLHCLLILWVLELNGNLVVARCVQGAEG